VQTALDNRIHSESERSAPHPFQSLEQNIQANIVQVWRDHVTVDLLMPQINISVTLQMLQMFVITDLNTQQLGPSIMTSTRRSVGVQLNVDMHTKKLEPTDVTLYSHTKKLVFLHKNFFLRYFDIYFSFVNELRSDKPFFLH